MMRHLRAKERIALISGAAAQDVIIAATSLPPACRPRAAIPRRLMREIPLPARNARAARLAGLRPCEFLERVSRIYTSPLPSHAHWRWGAPKSQRLSAVFPESRRARDDSHDALRSRAAPPAAAAAPGLLFADMPRAHRAYRAELRELVDDRRR